MMAKTGSTVAALSTSLDTSVTECRYCLYERSNVKEEEQTVRSWGVRAVHEAQCSRSHGKSYRRRFTQLDVVQMCAED